MPAAASDSSTPSPSVCPNGAATTGFGAKRTRCISAWPASRNPASAPGPPCWASPPTSVRLTPAEKNSPWLPITSARQASSPSSRSSACPSSAAASCPNALALAWNSRQRTPSPRSIRLAPRFAANSRPSAFSAVRSMFSGSRGTGS